MTNTKKLFGLSVLMLIAIVGFSLLSSAANLTISNVVVNNGQSPISPNAGSFPIAFDITNTGEADTGIAFTLQSAQGVMTLTMPTANIGAGTPTSPTTIRTSGTISFPPNQRGSLQGVITADPLQGDSRTAAFILQLSNSPSLKITQKTALTPSSNGSVELENTGNVNWNSVALTSSGAFAVTFHDQTGTQISSVSLTAGQKKTVIVSASDIGDIGIGGSSVQIIGTAEDGTSSSVNMSVQGTFCSSGSVGGDLELNDISIDLTGEGDEDEWHLLDTVEIEVTVENNGDDDLNDIFLEMGFFDGEGRNQVSDLEFESTDEEEYDLGDIDEGDDATATFTFKVPADFEDGNYRLTFKAYSDDLGEDVQCVDTARDLEDNDRYTTISVERENDEGNFIAFDEIEINPVEATCGDRVTMTMDVYNIGDEDQDQVRINLKNTELAIDEFVEIRTDLDQGDKETINFDFVIPQGATDKSYDLLLSAEYDYERGSYRQELDEDIRFPFRVIGCGNTPGNGNGGNNIALISASLESDEIVPGQEVVVKATISNLKTQRTSFVVQANDYQSWASLDRISPQIVDLGAGESKDVTLTFTVDEDAEGEQSFDIVVQDGVGGSQSREIALEIGEAGTGTDGGSFFDLGNNAFLWVIGAVNVILIVLIIVVAVRVARR